MGEIADSMLNGEMCAWCGVYLEPNETVYTLLNDHDVAYPDKEVKMPGNGDGFGIEVICCDCKYENDEDEDSFF